MLAYPADVGVQGRDEPGEAHPEAGARRLGLAIEVDVVEILKLRRRRATLQRAANDGEDALRKAHGLLHFPAAYRGRCRGAREHDGDGVGLADQIAELLLPRLTTKDACAVDQRLESAQDEPGDELVRKFKVLAGIGHEYLELRRFLRRGAQLPSPDRCIGSGWPVQ